jgi:hypothetical protein
VNTVMNASFSRNEGNLAIGLKLWFFWLLFGSTRSDCCPDTVSPTETFMEPFHENAKARATSLERKASSFPHTFSSVFTKCVNVQAFEIVIVKTTEERIKLN